MTTDRNDSSTQIRALEGEPLRIGSKRTGRFIPIGVKFAFAVLLTLAVIALAIGLGLSRVARQGLVQSKLRGAQMIPDQIRAVLEIAARYRVKATLILDVIHVLEYLWKAAYCFHPDASQEAEAWVTERLRALLSGHDPSQVAAGIRRSATRQQLSAAKRQAVDSSARYLINKRKLLG